MQFFDFIINKIKQYIVKKASEQQLVDIIQIRTKTLNLTYVELETDIKITNTFFLPIKILEITTDVLNPSDYKVGKMHYKEERIIKGKSAEQFTTQTKMSNITAFFNVLQRLLAIPIKMRSIGIAKIKVLWFEVEIPVDDYFEIQPHQLKIIEDLSEEEKLELAKKRTARKEKIKEQQFEKQAYLAQKRKLKEDNKQEITPNKSTNHKNTEVTNNETTNTITIENSIENLNIDIDEKFLDELDQQETDETTSI